MTDTRDATSSPFEPDPLYETTEDWGWDEPVCGYCGGDGGDPLNDYVLPCPECGGEG
jgi:hypothetical protein